MVVELFLLLKDSGLVWHDYPRAKKISISGKPRISYAEAVKYLKWAIK